ncbi:cobalamin binding intrinsic factor-like [Stigmatopora argus]
MASTRMAILSMVILVFSIQGTLTIAGEASVPLSLSVVDVLNGKSPQTYFTSVGERGVLLGALSRIHKSHPDFTYTTTLDQNYGLRLESVNGVAGNPRDQTFWLLLSEKTPLDVGIGCYIPAPNEHIVLNFTTWHK